MNCYVCDDNGRSIAAVAICRHCGIALCREHLDEDLLMPRRGGMAVKGCTHSPLHSAQARRHSIELPIPLEVHALER